MEEDKPAANLSLLMWLPVVGRSSFWSLTGLFFSIVVNLFSFFPSCKVFCLVQEWAVATSQMSEVPCNVGHIVVNEFSGMSIMGVYRA